MKKSLTVIILIFSFLTMYFDCKSIVAEDKGALSLPEGEVKELTLTLEGIIYKDPTSLKYNIIMLKFKTSDGEILDMQKAYTGKTTQELTPFIDKPVNITAKFLVEEKKVGDKTIKRHSIRNISEIKLVKSSSKKK